MNSNKTRRRKNFTSKIKNYDCQIEEKNKDWIISQRAIIAVIILLCIVLVIFGILIFNKNKINESIEKRNKLIPPNPEVKQPPSRSHLKIFKKYAICSDSEICSEIGSNIFKQGGNAVDVAIGTLFCVGVTTMQSMGIGGGFIMNIYRHKEKKSFTIDARECAPTNATANMFEKNINASIYGPLSIAVPGEVRGYWSVHQKFGKLKWKDIINPTLKICEEGFYITRHMADAMSFVPWIKNDINLKSFLVNQTTNEFYKEGSVIRPEKLCNTIRALAHNGGDDFYNGTIAKMLLQDLQDMGSIITQEDLEKYVVKWSDSIKIQLNTFKMFAVPFPGSGLFIGFILNILKGYGITEKDITSIDSETLLYHRITEAFKFSFGQYANYGDPNFVNVTQLEADLQSIDFATKIRDRINDSATSNDAFFYDTKYSPKNNHGTGHISVLAENGDAVSVTSTINFYFGSALTGKRTGVLFNNAMNDFSTPGNANIYGLSESPANYIDSRKRPLSSMSPTIITDKDGNVTLVIGAAGGSKITTAISTAIIRILWLSQDIKQSIDAARFHHQLFPMEVQYEYGVLSGILEGLKQKGHKERRYKERGTIICAIFKNETAIYGTADYRKLGDIIGI